MGAARRSRQLISVAAFAGSVFAMLECAKADSRDAGYVGLSQGDRLAGTWEIRFQLASGTLVRSSVTSTLVGTLTFAQATTKASGFPGMRPPLNYGLYNLDFSSFGFDTQHEGSVPVTVARVSPAERRSIDSVFIIIEPDGSGPSVTLAGELKDDRVVGDWSTASAGRTGIAEWGRFSMTRRNESMQPKWPLQTDRVSRPTSSPALP